MFVRRNTRGGNPRGEKHRLTSLLLALSSQPQMTRESSSFLNSFASLTTPDSLHIPSYLSFPLPASFTRAENTFLNPWSLQLSFCAEDTTQLNGQAVGLTVHSSGIRKGFLHAIHFHPSIHLSTHSSFLPSSIHPSTCPPIIIHVSTYPTLCPSIYLSIHLYVHLSIYLPTHSFI